MLILLADSNKFFSLVLHGMLLKAGFDHVNRVENGLECVLSFYEDDAPDVVIIDEQQCIVNGVDVLKNTLKANPSLSIIVLTDEERKVGFEFLRKDGTALRLPKSSITSENLPKILFSIFSKNIVETREKSISKAFEKFRKTSNPVKIFQHIRSFLFF